MALMSDRDCYTRSLEELLDRVKEGENADRLAAMLEYKAGKHPDAISVWDAWTSLHVYLSTATVFRCLDGNHDSSGGSHASRVYNHLVIEVNSKYASQRIITLKVFLDKGPTINEVPVKALITAQHEYGLELAVCKNKIINTFTDFQGKVYEDQEGSNFGLKFNDTVAVDNGIFDVSHQVFDGRLDIRNESARLLELDVADTEEAIGDLNDVVDDYNNRIYKKYWAESKLVEGYGIVTRYITGNGHTFYGYVQELIKRSIEQTLLGNTSLVQQSFNDCAHYDVGRFSVYVGEALVPMFAFNYVCLLNNAIQANVCVKYKRTHVLEILCHWQITNAMQNLTYAGDRVLRKRESAKHARARKPKTPRPRKKEDLSYEIEL